MPLHIRDRTRSARNILAAILVIIVGIYSLESRSSRAYVASASMPFASNAPSNHADTRSQLFSQHMNDTNELVSIIKDGSHELVKQKPENETRTRTNQLSSSESTTMHESFDDEPAFDKQSKVMASYWLDNHYFQAFNNVCNSCAVIITSYAMTSGRTVDKKQVNAYFKSPDFHFRHAIMILCKECVAAIIFYEKSILGRPFDIEEARIFIESEDYRNALNAYLYDDDVRSLFNMKDTDASINTEGHRGAVDELLKMP